MSLKRIVMLTIVSVALNFESVQAQAVKAQQSDQPTLSGIEVHFAKGDYSEQDKLRELLLKPLDNPDQSKDSFWNFKPLINESARLSNYPSIREWIKSSPEFLASIAAAMHSTDVGVRRQAACVLSYIGTKDVTAPLLDIGIEDNDPTVEYFSCAGLSRATGVGYVDCGGFRYGGKRFLSFWKRWAGYRDASGSPLVVPILEQAPPKFKYTNDLTNIVFGQTMLGDIDKADLIVAGKLVPVDFAGSTPGLYRRIAVDRVLKNNGNHDLNNIVVDSKFGATTDKGIYALIAEKNGTYRGTNGCYLHALPEAPGKKRTALESCRSRPEQRIISEMLAILSSSGPKLVPGQRIESSCAGAVAVGMGRGANGEVQMLTATPQKRVPRIDCSDADVMYGLSASALKGFESKDVVHELRTALRSSKLSDTSKLWMADVLLWFGDYDSLNIVKPLLMAKSPASETADCALRILIRDLRISDCARAPESVNSSLADKVSILSELMQSRNVEVRRAAAGNLIQFGLADSGKDIVCQPFAKIGLYDPDLIVRYYSVVGLERLANCSLKKHCTFNDFEKNQDEYVDRMRRWTSICPMEFPLSDDLKRCIVSPSGNIEDELRRLPECASRNGAKPSGGQL